MRAELLAALLLFAPAARAGDAGAEMTFRASRSVTFQVQAGSGTRVVYLSGLSDPAPVDWDTVLIQGELPDAAVRFQAAHPGAPMAWLDLQVKRFPDGRFWARGRLPKSRKSVALRALADGVAKDHEVSLFSVEVFVDAPETPAATPPPAPGPEDPAATPPAVHGRGEWGALPPTNPLEPDLHPWRVTLHHTDGRYTTDLAQSLREARFIQDFHQNGRKWSDIAYHYLVDPSGNIIEGRPLGTLGAHTLHNNDGNVGIVLLGNYHEPKYDRTTPAQLAAVAELGRFLVRRFGLDPESLKGHRDYKLTDCPGDLAYPKLAELREAFKPAPAKRRRAPGPVAAAAGAAGPDWDAQRANSSAAAPSATR